MHCRDPGRSQRMTKWEFAIGLEQESETPLFLQIARAIMADIRRARLRPGDRLPGSRTLAQSIGVQRGTVVSALDELVAEGWLVSRPARGVFVSPELPEQHPRRVRGGEQRGLPARFVLEPSASPSGELPYEIP